MKEIILKEDAGVKTIKLLHQTLADALDAESEIVLDFSNVKRLDLAVVQLIYAAGKEARRNNKALKMKSVSEAVKRQMWLGGLMK